MIPPPILPNLPRPAGNPEELRHVVPRSVLLSIVRHAEEGLHPTIRYTGEETIDRQEADRVRSDNLRALVRQVREIVEPTQRVPDGNPLLGSPLTRQDQTEFWKKFTGEQPRVP